LASGGDPGAAMKPPPFRYLAPASLAEALTMLAEHAGEAKLLAGGQSLMPMLNFRLLAPAVLIDINRLEELRGIALTDVGLRLGALTRHYALETSSAVGERFPIVAAVMRHVAHLAIRNRGTLAGSLAHADPAAELPLLALLLKAEIEIRRAGGRRRMPARDFFLGALTTALAEDEIVTAVELPLPQGPTGWGFEEVARRHGDFALAAVGATLRLDGGAIAEARLAVAGAGDTALRLTAVEAILQGQRLEADVADAACNAARTAVDPHDDLHASADYRRHLVGVLAGRALEAAWRRAGGNAA
jgi:CO/xanthine dehydrogenase FAD-binding subunit